MREQAAALNGATELDPATGSASLAEPPTSMKLLNRLWPLLVDLWIVAVWFAVAGLIGAVVWDQVTPLAEFTRTETNGSMDEQELAVQIATDGWFFVIAAVGGLLSGIALVVWRRRFPLLMVLLVAGGGALATYVMKEVGFDIGPADPDSVLPTVGVGDTVPLQLKPAAQGVYYVWSIAALAGSVLALWGGEYRASRRRHARQLREAQEPAGTGSGSGR